MTTIVAVKKNGIAVIAADTLTIWGNTKESANHLVNCSKIVQAGETFLGSAGSSANPLVLRHWIDNLEELPILDSVDAIFDAWLDLHTQLKERYFLREFDDERDQFESSRLSLLFANPNGIFSVTSLRAVSEYKKFTALGSGCDYALGAMQAVYDDPDLSAAKIAEIGIEVACEFDDGSGLPMELYEVNLR
jgi:ATP-dependent protease HslVU (ClpYQ), peptidase subunit